MAKSAELDCILLRIALARRSEAKEGAFFCDFCAKKTLSSSTYVTIRADLQDLLITICGKVIDVDRFVIL